MMKLQEILATSGGALFVILTLIQVTPIKVNPWSAIARGIGRAINGELEQKVDKIDREITDVKNDLSEQKAASARARILRFGDECLHGEKHSKEHFDQILIDITDYNDYCIAHPLFKNNVTELTSERIKTIYSQRLANNDFL